MVMPSRWRDDPDLSERVLAGFALIVGLAILALPADPATAWVRPEVAAAVVWAIGALLAAQYRLPMLTPFLALGALAVGGVVLPLKVQVPSGFTLVGAAKAGAPDTVLLLAAVVVVVHQTETARATAQRLTQEVRRRSRVETALRRSQEVLERRVAEGTADLGEKQRELAHINARLEGLATTDDLTGLCNRRRFLELVDAEFEAAKRHERTFAVIMFDLDRFKPVNDTYGHHAGDFVLQRAAAVCAERLRETDWLARYGGEEFMALITGATAQAAGEVAERMRAALEGTPVTYDGHQIRITASFGGTALGANDTDVEAVLHRVDEGAYEAKRAGRNCVAVREP